MFVLNQDKWTQRGFKMTPDKTLAWMVSNDQLIYVRPYDEEAYGGIDKHGKQGTIVGKIYTLTGTNEQIAVFVGNDPYISHSHISIDETVLPEDAKPYTWILDIDNAAALMVPFNRASKGFIPIIWNLGSKESICRIDANIDNIDSVYQLELYYPSVSLPEEASLRYMVLELRNMDNKLFGYNRNHLAYNGRLDDASQDYPLTLDRHLTKNIDLQNHTASLIHDESYYKSIHKVEKLNRQASKWLDREDRDFGLPTNDKSYNKSEGFNGKAKGLLDAAALPGAARK